MPPRLLTPWPKNWAEWSSRMLPESWTRHESVSKLLVVSTGGNVAVATVPFGLEPGTAVVAHSSQGMVRESEMTEQEKNLNKNRLFAGHSGEFIPVVDRFPGGQLALLNMPSICSFASQIKRINTLVLVPPGTMEEIDITVRVGEIWVFGNPVISSRSFANSPEGKLQRKHQPAPQKIRAKMVAGDMVLVDPVATSIEATNWLGDVKLNWDVPRQEEASSPSSSSSSSSKENSGDDNDNDAVLIKHLQAKTLLGDARLTVFTDAPAPSVASPMGDVPWIDGKLVGANEKKFSIMRSEPGRSFTDAVNDSSGFRSKKKKLMTGADLRAKWANGIGRDFLQIQPTAGKSR